VYYAALALGLLVFATIPKLSLRSDDQSLLQLTTGGLISHLFFVHNLDPGRLSQMNVPLWSTHTRCSATSSSRSFSWRCARRR
jgi:hypothetical protein